MRNSRRSPQAAANHRILKRARIAATSAFLVVLATSLLPSPKASAGSGSAGVIELLLGFSAKETCSCAFVVGQTDTYCQAFGQQKGYDGVTLTIDHAAKTVTSDAGTGKTRIARVVKGGGCLLDGL
jgi:type IV secretory pathway TrbL component